MKFQDHIEVILDDLGRKCCVIESPYKHVASYYDVRDLCSKLEQVPWTKVYDKNANVTRSSAWYVVSGCSCAYSYGNRKWEPLWFEPWMSKLADNLAEIFNFDSSPNSVNLNMYAGDDQS